MFDGAAEPLPESLLPEEAHECSVLLSQAREGCRDAFDTLFSEARGPILRLIRKQLGPILRGHVEPEDVLQATLTRAFRRFGQFEGTSLRSLLAWLFRIAQNVIRDEADYLRRARRSVFCTVPLGEDAEAAPQDGPTEFSRLVAHEEAARLARALRSLNEAQRAVVTLRYYEELSFPEVGARLGKNPDACRMLLARALRVLAREMRPESADSAATSSRSRGRSARRLATVLPGPWGGLSTPARERLNAEETNGRGASMPVRSASARG
jgi:RNA polymerase sigma-70 factor (ECF subfamily)